MGHLRQVRNHMCNQHTKKFRAIYAIMVDKLWMIRKSGKKVMTEVKRRNLMKLSVVHTPNQTDKHRKVDER